MKQLLLLIAVCALAELTSGCSLITDVDDFEFADAGVPRDGSTDADEDSGTDGGVDAAHDAGEEVDASDGCGLHVGRFTHERGTTCPSGRGAGLARFNDDPTSEIGTTTVSSCVALDVNGSGTLVFDARHTDATCGDTCGEDYCGETIALLVFAVRDDGSTTRLFAEELSPASATEAVNVQPEYTELLLCRGGGGPGRDNIVIERLRAC